MKESDYEHLPVGIRQFVTSKEYMNAEKDCWQEVLHELELLFNANNNSRRLSTYSEAVLCKGIGSGKSFFVSMVFAYGVYRLLCFKSPQEVYALAKGSNITLVNMSKSGQQAKKVVFGEIKARIEGSPWFQKYALPDQKIQSEMRFDKGVVIFPGNSRETFPLGYNVFIANMDEASFYTETETHDVAEEIYNALERRIKSRFGSSGLLVITSSPRYEDDFTEKKVSEGKVNGSNILAIRKATWEMRPDDRRDIEAGNCFEEESPQGKKKAKIPVKYKSAFNRDKKKAWRDFGAVASLTLEPYFTDEEIAKIEAMMGRTQKTTIENIQRTGHPYFAHIDLGLTRDACGVAIGYYDESRQTTMIEVVLRIVSARRAKELDNKQQQYDMIIGSTEVDFEQVRLLITNLRNKGFGIYQVTYDQYQSVESRQMLEKEGIKTELLSVDRNTSAYDTLKSLINTGKINIVSHDHLLMEFKRLEYKDGKRIDHPKPNGSKDCADAVAGVCKSIAEALDEEVEDEVIETDDSCRVEITPEI